MSTLTTIQFYLKQSELNGFLTTGFDNARNIYISWKRMKLSSWTGSNIREGSLPWNFGKCRVILYLQLCTPLLFSQNNPSPEVLPWNPKSQLPVLREIIVFVHPIVERLTVAVGQLGYITPWNLESGGTSLLWNPITSGAELYYFKSVAVVKASLH